MTIAQFERPPEGLESGLYTPLIAVVVLYVILFVAARVIGNRGDSETAETLDTLGFGLVLLTGVYVLGLALYAVSQRSEGVWDMVVVILVVAIFFALLLLFMLLWEMAIGAIGRRRRGRRALIAAPAADDPGREEPTSQAHAGQ